MRFAEFSIKEFPRVHVKLNNRIENKEEYTHFENEWLACYRKKQNFHFIFDSTEVGWIHPKYAFYVTTFIKKIKELSPQYLEFSIIIVNNSYIQHLLSWIFRVQKPVAPVYIISKNHDIHNLLKKIYEKNIIDDDVIMVNP